MANPVTWFEIIGPDAKAIQKFYRDVFGWKMTPPGGEEMGYYSMLQGHEPGIGGGLGQGGPARVTVYIESADPQKLLDRAIASGGTLMMPITSVTPETTIGMFSDPAGNTVGLLKANARAGAASTTSSNGSSTRAARPRAKAAASRSSARAKKSASGGRKTAAKKTAAKRKATKRAKRR